MIIGIILSILIIAAIVLYVIYKKYKNFVLEHSNLIKEVKCVNEKYIFHEVKDYYLINRYDNEHFYNNISTADYLIYQLQFIKKEVIDLMNKIFENYNNYDFYKYDIKNICIEKDFDVDKLPKFNFLLDKIIKIEYNKLIYRPQVKFQMTIKLIRTNINGRYLKSKITTFDSEFIEDIIFKLKDKYGDRYTDRSIWDSICRVERGKVSNRMRFSIYARDNYRCRKCGRKTNDLEVDHIIPIAKGGKSTYDNLQTLCKRCNMQKSDTIEAVNVKNNPNIKICPKCGAPLKLKKGKYGDFYGCMNYPKCTYIERTR